MIFSFEVFAEYLGQSRFAIAAGVTLLIAIAAQTIGVLIGLVLALFSLSRFSALRWIAATYIWIWCSTPPLVQLFLLFFGLPQLGIRLSPIEAGLIGLGFHAASYMAEIIRAGIQSVDTDQMQAARAMGFSRLRAMRYVILPQALRVILPPFGNEFASMMRTSSLLSVISIEELLRVTRIAINETYQVIELYSVAAVYYLAMYTMWIVVQAWLERVATRGSVARNLGNPIADAEHVRG
ncbi:MAG: amino acid ABC transporter permease [Hyphomicrobiales bacterium]|nr:amino acid ABC transporter permease [Hyphomicrobiales bacterium]